MMGQTGVQSSTVILEPKLAQFQSCVLTPDGQKEFERKFFVEQESI